MAASGAIVVIDRCGKCKNVGCGSGWFTKFAFGSGLKPSFEVARRSSPYRYLHPGGSCVWEEHGQFEQRSKGEKSPKKAFRPKDREGSSYEDSCPPEYMGKQPDWRGKGTRQNDGDSKRDAYRTHERQS